MIRIGDLNQASVFNRQAPWGVRMGDTPEGPVNRLLNVRTQAILSRGALLIPTLLWHPRALALFPPKGDIGVGAETTPGSNIQRLFPLPLSSWTEEEVSILKAVAANPTQEELADIALIDSVFGFGPPTRSTMFKSRASPVWATLNSLWAIVCQGYQAPPRAGHRVHRNIPGLAAGNPFYCTGAPSAGPAFVGHPTAAEYLDLAGSGEWGEDRNVVRNAAVMLATARVYPFPGPLPADPVVWYRHNQGAISEYVKEDVRLSEPLVRLWITPVTLQTYEAVAAEIIADLEDEQKKDRRRLIIKAIAAVAVAAFLSAGMATIFTGAQASAAASFVREEYTKAEVENVVEDLEELSGVFQVTDPLFAEEVRKFNDVWKYFASQAEPAPDDGVVTPDGDDDSGSDTPLIVGGGLGAAVLLFFILR